MRKTKNLPEYLYYFFTALFTGLAVFFNSKYVEYFVHSHYEDFKTRFPEDHYVMLEGLGIFSYLPGFFFACVAQIMLPIVLMMLVSRFFAVNTNKPTEDRLKTARANYLPHFLAPYAVTILIFEEVTLEKISPVFYARFYHFTPTNPLRELLSFGTIDEITIFLTMLLFISVALSMIFDALACHTSFLSITANVFAVILILWEIALNWHTVAMVFGNCLWPFIFLYTLLFFTEVIILLHCLHERQRNRKDKANKKDKDGKKSKGSPEKKEGVIIPLYDGQN